MGKLFERLTKLEDALATYLPKVRPVGVERVSIDDLLGRVLAVDLTAVIDDPPFPRAAFDGYAVRAEDTFGASKTSPITLRVIGEIKAGETPEITLGEMEAVRIATGAKLPKGANAVLALEDSKELDGYVEVYRQVSMGTNVDPPGSDFKRGEVFLEKGRVIGAFELLAIASQNLTEVEVWRRPRIGVIATGDELIEPGEPLESGKVVSSNRFMIEGLLKDVADVHYLGIVRDDEEQLRRAIERASNQFDALVATAGTSDGKRDLVPKILERLGGEVVVHGIAIMPGKPTLLGLLNGKPFVGLPGYPVSASIAVMEVLLPIVDRMAGISGGRIWNTVKARLARRIPSRPGIRHYVRVKLSLSGEGYIAVPVRVTGSGIVSSLVRSQGIVIVPEEREGFEKGEVVNVRLLRRWTW